MSITMPVSSVQPIEFVKKSGMQYENLNGDFIVRDGISPSGKYEQEVRAFLMRYTGRPFR